jgi:hypothetical protein
MAALAVFLQDRRDIFRKRRRIHIPHLRKKTRCRTDCKQQSKNCTIHGVYASLASASVPILGAGSAIISRMSNTSSGSHRTSRNLEPSPSTKLVFQANTRKESARSIVPGISLGLCFPHRDANFSLGQGRRWPRNSEARLCAPTPNGLISASTCPSFS